MLLNTMLGIIENWQIVKLRKFDIHELSVSDFAKPPTCHTHVAS